MYKGNKIPVKTDIDIKSCIFNYVKDDKRNGLKNGLVIACMIGDDPNVYLGWSKCRKDDVFSQQEAFDIALFRAYANKLAGDKFEHTQLGNEIIIPGYMKLPPSLREPMIAFLVRCNRYFKSQECDFNKVLKDAVEMISARAENDLFKMIMQSNIINPSTDFIKITLP